jgi:hypothetical protein
MIVDSNEFVELLDSTHWWDKYDFEKHNWSVKNIGGRTHDSIAFKFYLRWAILYICWGDRVEVIPLDTQSS